MTGQPSERVYISMAEDETLEEFSRRAILAATRVLEDPEYEEAAEKMRRAATGEPGQGVQDAEDPVG